MEKTVSFISVLVVLSTLPMTAGFACATLIALATIVVLNGKLPKTVNLTRKSH